VIKWPVKLHVRFYFLKSFYVFSKSKNMTFLTFFSVVALAHVFSNSNTAV